MKSLLASMALLFLQAKGGKTLDEYLKAVPADARAAVGRVLDEKTQAAQAAKITENDLFGLGLAIDDVVKLHPWNHRLPVMTAALKGRHGNAASVVLHALAVRAMTDGIVEEGQIGDFRALHRFAIEAAAPFVGDKEVSSRLMAVNFLKTVADTAFADAKGKSVPLHAPETRALIRKALGNAAKDPNERISRWAKEGLEGLNRVEK